MASTFNFGIDLTARAELELANILARRFVATYKGMLPDEIARRAPRAHFLGALADHAGYTALPEIAKAVDSSLLSKFDREFMAKGKMVPLAYADDVLAVAIADPSNRVGIDYCRHSFPSAEINIFITYAQEISKVLEGAMLSEIVEAPLEQSEIIVESTTKQDFDLTVVYEDYVAEFTRSLLLKAVQLGVSDIHIKTEKDAFYYQYRIDGDCGPKMPISPNIKAKLDAFLIVKAGKPVDKKIAPLSGRFTVALDGRKIDIRYERHPTHRGYHVTIRLLDKSQVELTLGMGALKFNDKVLETIYRVLALPDGIIAISGPTGSGKSSTMTAMLKELNRDKYNILTLENPVEEEIPGITHVQIDNSNTTIFDEYMSSFMRSDPDIIFIGEIRDNPTASAAINAATTGHQVLSTIHAARASLVISRLEHFNIRRFDIAENLKAACAQRLVRTVCQKCSTEKKYEKSVLLRNGLPENFGDIVTRHHNNKGCPECMGGYKGRLSLFEILPISLELSSRLASSPISALDIENAVREEFKIPLLRDLALKAIEDGLTDIEAVRDVVAMTI